MAEQLHTRLRSLSTMPGVSWSGVKDTTTGLWDSVKVCSGVINHDSLSGSLMPAELYLQERIVPIEEG